MADNQFIVLVRHTVSREVWVKAANADEAKGRARIMSEQDIEVVFDDVDSISTEVVEAREASE